jgi:small subunit ribosomal protein S20
MAITKGAKKAIRSSGRKRVFNLRRKNELSETVKKVRKFIIEGKKDEAQRLIPTAYKAIDKAQKRGVIKKNTAARKKSRLMRALNGVK